MASASFQTPRMTAHRLSPADLTILRDIHTDLATMKTLSADGSVLAEETSRAILDQHLRHWAAYDFGMWVFLQRRNEEAIGYCGLRQYELQGAAEIELFFGVRSKFFRMGFGTEMARAVIAIGFQEIGLSSVIAFTLKDNAGSRALMATIGMGYQRLIEHAGLPHLMYRLNRVSLTIR